MSKQIKPMFFARYNELRRSASALAQMMADRPARDVTGLDLADLRDEVEAITQSFHEANAYHNAWKSGTRKVDED